MPSNRTVPTITIISLLLLTIVFFQGESKYFEWGKLADDEKIANYFTSFEAIFVAATLFYIGKQLEESRLARLKSYEPILMPIQTRFSWVQIDMAARNWLNPVNFDTHFVVNRYDTGSPELRNIGTGIAKNVSITWEYDSLAVRSKIVLIHDQDKQLWNQESMKHSDLNVILVEQQVVILSPSFYLLMWSDDAAFLRTALHDDETPTPSLHLRLTYNDKDGNEIKKKYQANVNIENDNNGEFLVIDYVDVT